MALDKLVDSSQLDGALGSTAEAIRDKTGSNSTIAWDMDTGFYDAIEEIVTLEEGTADGTATSSDILYGKTAYVDGAKVVGTIPSKTSANLTVSGATVTAPAGHYAEDAAKTIGNGTVVASISSNMGGSASMAATGFTASGSATSYYVTLSTTAGSVKAKAQGSTAGYIATSISDETAATSVSVSGDGNKLYIPAGSVTTSLTADGMSTYFNSGTSSDKNVTLTPKYTNTAGYKAAVTTATNNGGTAYYKIKTASPTFSAAPTGDSTATSTTASISNTTNNSGVSIQTKYSINAATVSYAAASTGWIDKAANASTGSSTTAKSATNGTAYYINGVTLTAPSSESEPRTFSITVPNGSSAANITFTFTVDASGNTTVTES